MTGARHLTALALSLVTLLAWRSGEDARASGGEARGQAPTYRVLLPDKVQVVAGQSGRLDIGLVPSEGYRFDLNGPLRILLELPEKSGLRVKKRRLSRRDASSGEKTAPRFVIALRAASAGRYPLTIAIRLWVCRGEVCRAESTRRRLQVEVVPAPAESEARDASS